MVEFMATLWRLVRVTPHGPLAGEKAGKGGRARGGPFLLPTLDDVSLELLCARGLQNLQLCHGHFLKEMELA